MTKSNEGYEPTIFEDASPTIALNEMSYLPTILSLKWVEKSVIERKQYEDLNSLLIVSRKKWAFNVAINTHCKWSQLHYITKTFQQKREYDMTKHACFGTLLEVYPQRYFCIGLLQNIMIRRITESQSMNHELWFVIGKSMAWLSKQEFYLITRLKFGLMPDVFKEPYKVAADRIHARYWNRQEKVKVQALLDTFRGGNFQRPEDSTKMALVLIANNILFGQDYGRRVTPWLLSLVEDINAWNVFPWGHYLWALETLEQIVDEASQKYFVDLDVPLSEGHQEVLHLTVLVVEHDDADDGHHHELGVHIHDDVLGASGEHVTHVDDVVNEAMAGDVTLQSDDAEREHVLLPKSIIDASTGREGDLDSVVAEGELLPPIEAFVKAIARAMVLYHQSLPDAVETQS
ncbi:Uncharacterized protein TCM_033152 [Theobroma cacao]|uniref:DUF1985 domain-containing protein n=1 Tax=Theobroma cacao TaxID=3641 RepID=A0A061FAV2_THECC|nr:Uncharacterized protein TCM_033152 [Theobroma cacao]